MEKSTRPRKSTTSRVAVHTTTVPIDPRAQLPPGEVVIDMTAGARNDSVHAELPMREPTSAGDIMTDSLKTASPETDLATVAAMMRDHNIGIVPIVDDQGRVVGVVTDRDIVVRADANATPAAELRAIDIMTRHLVTAHEADDILDVLDRMGEERVHRMLVVGQDERLVGIISISDLAHRTDLPERVQDTVDQIARPRP